VYEILSGITNSSVSRMKKTWANLSKETKDIFEGLKSYLDNNKNFNYLRTIQRFNNVPCLPYIGIFLTDLTFIEEGNKSMNESRINFDKKRKIFKIIQNLVQYQSVDFGFVPVGEYKDYIKLITFEDDNKNYKASLSNEPRE
jgi:hypothetical protein